MLGYAPQTILRTGTRLRQLANTQRQTVADRLRYSENVWQGELQLRSGFDLAGTRHELTYGIAASTTATDYARRDVTTNLSTGAVTVTRAGGFNFANADTRRLDGFVQDEVTLFGGRLTLVPGLRFSNTAITPRPDADYLIVAGRAPRNLDASNLSLGFGGIFRLDDNFSLYGNYGEGFKMPTAEQLFTSLPSTTFNLIPNPNLRPEKVRSVEGGIRAQFDSVYVSLGLFRADYKDFIQSFVSIPNSIDLTYQNLSAVTVQGIEAAGAWRFHPRWTLQASASLQDGSQKATPGSARTFFDGARPLSGTIGVTYDAPETRLRLTLNSSFATAQERASTSTRYLPGGYAVFDVLASWRPFERFELTGGIFNLSNTRYMPLPPGGTAYDRSQFATSATKATNPIELQIAPGISFRVGAKLTF
jgi:hemoglobin/transferrin/lactoferrin receptor protein